jgi:formate dehydrogenase subunit beta
MDTALKLNGGAEEALKKLLIRLLEKGKIEAAIVLDHAGGGGGAAYSLITDPEVLERTCPLLPLMPANAASPLSRLTLRESFPGIVAAVVRPCELRAFIELVKRGQGSLENIILISSVCGGVYPSQETLADGGIEKKLPEYRHAMRTCEIAADIRVACRICERFIPMGADVTVAAMGQEDPERCCTVLVQTDRGKELLQALDEEMIAEKLAGSPLESDLIRKHHGLRRDQKKKLFQDMKLDQSGLDGLVEIFGRCIGCHGCRAVCPICHCELCIFESKDFEPKPADFERDLSRKGRLRVPPDTLLYHLGRLNHMAVSCVGCGSCTDVCPVDIPVSSIFAQVGESLQELFDYLPGKDPDEEVPFTRYETEELVEFED